MGIKLDNIEIDQLGTAEKIIITKDNTTIVKGGGTREAVAGRVQQIRRQIENTDSDYDREKLEERLAKLAGGVAKLSVGAATETELKEKKHRFEDALSATRAAVEEGIVAGGGSTSGSRRERFERHEGHHRRRADRHQHRPQSVGRAAPSNRRKRGHGRLASSSTACAKAAKASV